jgi:hypothetical protein
MVAISEQDKKLRAELAKELGFSPATLDPEDIARHRRAKAAFDSRYSGTRRWEHFRIRAEREANEARQRAEVADLYE